MTCLYNIHMQYILSFIIIITMSIDPFSLLLYKRNSTKKKTRVTVQFCEILNLSI